ncbi:cupredoxin family copper-binding protein [Candidatus Saccharibacteria bacterium]|nr:cupredoxin family copper-binding protein [Candidatus Saccharibacteria bacterium]
MKKSLIFVILAVLVLGVGGFWILNRGNSSSSEKTSENVVADNNTNQEESSNSVEIKNMAFSQSTITIKKGETVTWTNKDSMAHTVVESDSQDGPKSGNLANGDSYSFTFNTSGTFEYHCSIHPSMTGKVVVE